MTWFKVDDGFPLHPKALGAGNAAVGLWTRVGAWCAQQLTDGLVDGPMVQVLGGRPADAAALVRVGLWHGHGHQCLRCVEPAAGGWVIHDWAEYNPSRAQVMAERDAAAERQRRARESRRDSRRDSRVSHGVSHAEVLGQSQVPRPDPTRTDETNPVSSAPDPSRFDVDRVCQHLADRIQANGSKRPTVTQRWLDAARLLIDVDGRTETQVIAAIDWSQADEFWRANILSMPTLREKYDQLRLAAARTPTSTRDVDLGPAMARAQQKEMSA